MYNIRGIKFHLQALADERTESGKIQVNSGNIRKKEKIMKKIKVFWESLDDITTVSKRELFSGLLCCALAGIVFGVFFGPKKNVTIGSHNGCKNGCQDEDGSRLCND